MPRRARRGPGTARASIRAGFHPGAGRGPSSSSSTRLVDRAIPRQPGGLQLHGDQGARRLRGEQQSQSARVGASRRRARAGGRVPPPPLPRVGVAMAVDGPTSAHRPRRAGRRMVRCRRIRRPRRSRRGRTACCAAWPTGRPGRAPCGRGLGRAGRQPRRSRAIGGRARVRRRGRPVEDRRAQPKVVAAFDAHARPRAVAGTIVGSRPTPIADVRAPRARGPRRPGRRTRPPRSGRCPRRGRRGRCGPPPPPPTTICTRPFSRAPTTVSAGTRHH